MKKTIFLFFALLTACLLPVHAQKYSFTTVPGDLMQTRIYTLPNGLKVYMSVNKEKPRVQCNIAVRTGSRNDPKETTGLAHYLEHLMFKGTKSFGTIDYEKEKPYLDEITRRYEAYRKLTDPQERKQAYHEIDSVSQLAAKYNIPNEYDKLMSSIGSEGSNAFTSNDITCYVENVPNNELENWAKVQSDRFKNMVIRGFHTELEAVYEEKNITMGSDQDKEFAALNKLLYPTHPYGTQTTIGEQEHLKNPSIVNIMNYFHHYYVPNNVAIVMAGDFDPDQTIALIDKYFGDWKPSADLTRPEFEPQPEITAEKDTTIWGNDAANVFLGWKFEGASSLQADTLDLISDLISNGKAGLLDELVQNMDVQYAGAYSDNLRDYSTFFIYVMPKPGQTLQQAKEVVLAQIDKLRKGDFSDEMLEAVTANSKVSYYKYIDNNSNRARLMADAFVTNNPWENVCQRLDRQGKITKQNVVNFATRYLRHDNLAVVYKEIGEDTTLKKIEKPQITPIPANRDYQSEFVKNIVNAEVAPIKPQFVDYNKDLTKTQLKPGEMLLYKKNESDGLFNLVFRYDIGEESDNLFGYAADYLNYIGTQKKSLQEIQRAFYDLACNFSVAQTRNHITVSLSGLAENMSKALALANEYLSTAKADKGSWGKFIDLLIKSRSDAKTEQESCFSALFNYGVYGKYNPQTNIQSIDALKAMDPQALVDKLKVLKTTQHYVLFYGPQSEKEVAALVGKTFTTAKKFQPWKGEKKEYREQTTPVNEIFLAPYDAKNIYLRMIHNENRPFSEADLGKESLFNDYFGGGMNAIVFQELRETRGLAYNAWAMYSTPPLKNHSEYFVTHIISQNDKMMDCIRTFHSILDSIPQNLKAFNLAKQSLKKSIEAARTTKMDVIYSYLNAQERGMDKSVNEVVYSQLPNISFEDVINFEKENIAGKTYRYVILGDEKNLDIKALEKIAPVKRLTLTDIFGY